MSKYQKEKDFVRKWLPLLIKIDEDESLKDRCRNYNAFISSKEANQLVEDLDFYNFLKEGYDSGIVFGDYSRYIDKMDQLDIVHPSDEFISKLSEIEIISCIAFHFRMDHWNNGSLINESFVEGSLLKFFKALTK